MVDGERWSIVVRYSIRSARGEWTAGTEDKEIIERFGIVALRVNR
jgi:hypothetical protein